MSRARTGSGWRTVLARRVARLRPPLWALVLTCATVALGGIAWTHHGWSTHFERAHALEDALGETLRHVDQAQSLAREQAAAQERIAATPSVQVVRPARAEDGPDPIAEPDLDDDAIERSIAEIRRFNVNVGIRAPRFGFR